MPKSKKRQQQPQQKQRKPKQKVKTVYVQQPMSIGAQLGHGLQKFGESMFARIFGQGDYQISENIDSVSKNSLMGASMKPPSFASAGKGQFVFEHSEYCFDLIGGNSGAYKVNTYDIQPAIGDLFPWLSSIAPNFEYYAIEGLLFRYVSSSGESVASTNTSLGSVMMYVNNDPYDAASLTKQALLQYEGCVDAKPSKNIMIGGECDPKRLVSDKFFVGSSVPFGADKRFYNYGQLVVASSGIPGDSVTLGEIWCHYRIRFFVAKTPLDNSLGGVQRGLVARRSAASNSDPLGAPVSISSTLPNASIFNETISFDSDPKQYFFVSLVWSGSSVTTAQPSFTIVGATLINYFNNGSSNAASNWGQVGTRATASFVVQVDDDASRVNIQVGSNGTLPGVSYVDVTILQIDGSNYSL